MAKTKDMIQTAIIFLFVLLFISLSKIVNLTTDFLWFSSIGFEEIFLTELTTKIALFFVGALFFLIFLTINLWVVKRLQKEEPLIPFKYKFLIGVFISFLMGGFLSSNWLVILKFLNQASFNLKDPFFLKDVSFYIFSLPFFSVIWQFIFTTLMLTGIFVAADYLQSLIKQLFTPEYDTSTQIPTYSFDWKNSLSKIKKKPMTHMTILASFLFILLAVKHYLTRFSIMFSEKGIVVGAGYTDVAVALPIFTGMMILAGAVTLFLIIRILFIARKPKLRKRHIVLYVIGLYLLFGFIGPNIVPDIYQEIWVSPNEFNLEETYIKHNINFTRQAYGLDEIKEKPYEVMKDFSPEKLDKDSPTINNIRLLDRRPLKATYKQTQEIRLYYDLSNIDVDRYYINGTYTEVLLAARELNQRQISDNARTWVNLHQVYTHGYGIVMSPVNKITKEGLPEYYLKDVPPVNQVGDPKLDLERPEIYYGEKNNQYVLVDTETEEFDYPQGDNNKYVNYEGGGGVKLDSWWKKLFMAIRFGDLKILLSSDVDENSKIMFFRNVAERVQRITPFLNFNSEPYPVISEGKLYWIIDAYTVARNHPFSQKFHDINYIKNPVKIVIDAYEGDVDYYVIEEDEPIMQTINNIFPENFRSFEEMPEGLKEHIRYPKDLFKIQLEIFRNYHMQDPQVFYNKEDAWEIPREIYGTGSEIKVEPYHIIMKLPEEEKEEFILMSTYTPINKNNMNAWLAARSDGDDYGKLFLYRFPKDKLVYGPSQVEAKFDQDAEISEQLTLWSQRGSQIRRGNLLVIPYEGNILYVEPLYLESESGGLPQLKRILVSDGDRVYMEETLEQGLNKLFNISGEDKVDDETIDNQTEVIFIEEDLIQDAVRYYSQITESMRNNDWYSLGEGFDKLGEVLENLNSSVER